jgi:hypothetical protein
MPEIVLTAVETNDDHHTDRRADLRVEWPVVPRKGESLWVAGTAYDVSDVWHDITEKPSRVQVDFQCGLDEFENILSKPGWELRKHT